MIDFNKMKILAFLTVTVLVPNMFGQGEGPCWVLHWDTVTGGSNIDDPSPGECEYEIDIENTSGEASMGFTIPPDFTASQEHWISFRFSAIQFDRSYQGHFRILSLMANGGGDLMFSIDLYWSQFFTRQGELFLEAMAYPALKGPFQSDPTIAVTPIPHNVSEAFDHHVTVSVKLTESSGPSAEDGSIELWIDGSLVANSPDMDFDWANDRPPQLVSFGVIEIFEPTTSGKLGIAPVRPAPYSPTF